MAACREHSYAHSPRVTPADVAAVSLDCHGGDAGGPLAMPVTSCYELKCQHAGEGSSSVDLANANLSFLTFIYPGNIG